MTSWLDSPSPRDTLLGLKQFLPVWPIALPEVTDLLEVCHSNTLYQTDGKLTCQVKKCR